MTRCTRIVLCLAVILGFGLRARAEERDPEPEPRRIPFTHPLPNETDWYGIYHGRRKVGAGFQSLRLETGAKPRYRSRSVFQAEVFVPGQRGTLDFDGADVFRGSAPFELLDTKERSLDGNEERRIALELRDGGYVGSLRSADAARPLSFPNVDYSLVDRMTHVQWTRAHPQVGEVLRVREFNITVLEEEIVRYEVMQRKHVMTSAVRAEIFEVDMQSDVRGSLGRAWIDGEGRLLSMKIANALELRLEHEGQARVDRFASDLFAFGRAPAVEPFGDPRTVERMDIRVFGRGSERIPVTVRQAVRVDRDLETVYVQVAAGTDEGAPVEAPDTDPRVDPFLAATERHLVADPRLRAMAKEALGDTDTPDAKVRALLRYVSAYLRDAYVPYEPPMRDLLIDPIGDGSEHALLFTTLARIAGLPAREVQGLVYLGDEVQAFGGHVWNQVRLGDRWVEVDPTWNQRHVDGTHILLHVGERDVAELLAKTRHFAVEKGAVTRRDAGR